MPPALFVLTRILANPLSNAFQKRLTQESANPVFIIAASHALLSVVCLPALFHQSTLLLATAFWANMALCALLAVSSNVLLVYALRSMDLSVLGPVNAYKSVVSMLLAVFLIGETPTAVGVVGVALIVAGSYFVVDRMPDTSTRSAFARFFQERGIQLRFAALALSATEAVFLKKALLLSSPVTTFVVWAVFGFALAAALVAVSGRARLHDEFERFRWNVRSYVWLAITTGVTQLTTLFAFGMLQVGYSLALFQLSTLVSVFLGYRYFQERSIGRRLIGAVVMVAGAAMIVTAER